MRPAWLALMPCLANGLVALAPAAPARAPAQSVGLYERLLCASELLDAGGCVRLCRADIERTLDDMHLLHSPLPGVTPPTSFLPTSLRAPFSDVDVTELVRSRLPRVLDRHPIIGSMVGELMGNDDLYASVHFGAAQRDDESVSFAALCRRLVSAIYVLEALLALDADGRRSLAQWYEAQLEARAGGARPSSARDAAMGFFLDVKGESVLASINAFETMRRLGTPGESTRAEARKLSDVINAAMAVNIFEAVISNLTFARWPDNARAGLALLLAPPGEYRADLTQNLSPAWRNLYLAWNANFIWPAHETADMLAFAMLLTPTISLGGPETFGYDRAHSLFWVVRSAQLSRAERRTHAARRWRIRQLPPAHDRQPLTTRGAKLTRAAGELLAASVGEDVARGSAWARVGRLLPAQLARAARVYAMMPKASPAKLRLL